ncbi:helix-turn-helix domain-containing protein [Agrobacterium tumefaciens]|nr:helix-turn-helix domain-containing protein [Agrobacterium tumefaciens]NTE22273.1 helix-turn-helix domain-containing protein [Agrobacterium tumefaciens]
MQDIISKKSIGDRLKTLRMESRLSQAQASEALGLSRSHYSQVELGKQFPSYSVLSKVSEFYGKDYQWILHGEVSQLSAGYEKGEAKRDNLHEVISGESSVSNKNESLGKEVALIKSEDFIMYLKRRSDNLFLEALPKIYLPLQQLSNGPYRAFQVEGDIPDISYFDQDIVIGEWIEDKNRVVISRVYVIVLQDDILITKIQAFHNEGYLECLGTQVSSEKISFNQIMELWEVKVKISFRQPKVASQSIDPYRNMEKAIHELTEEVNRIKNT